MTIDERIMYLEVLADNIDRNLKILEKDVSEMNIRLKILDDLNERDHDNIWDVLGRHNDSLRTQNDVMQSILNTKNNS